MTELTPGEMAYKDGVLAGYREINATLVEHAQELRAAGIDDVRIVNAVVAVLYELAEGVRPVCGDLIPPQYGAHAYAILTVAKLEQP